MNLLPNRIAVSVPERISKIGNLHIDTSFPAGAEYNYQDECTKVRLQVLRSPEAQYMKKYGQLNKLRKLLEREVARVPRETNEATYGAGRYNNVYATVLASGVDGVLPGDVIYFGYNTLETAKQRHGIFQDDYFPGKWTVINGTSCLFLVRDDKFIHMLNDNVLVTPIPLPKLGGVNVSAGGILYVRKESTFEEQMGVLAHAPSGSPLPVGKTVAFEKGCDIPIEYEMIRSLPETFFCMKEQEVLGAYDEEGNFRPNPVRSLQFAE